VVVSIRILALSKLVTPTTEIAFTRLLVVNLPILVQKTLIQILAPLMPAIQPTPLSPALKEFLVLSLKISLKLNVKMEMVVPLILEYLPQQIAAFTLPEIALVLLLAKMAPSLNALTIQIL
jgi:hypothetical protein